MVAAVVLGASGPVGTVRTHDPRAGTIDWDDPQAAADSGDPWAQPSRILTIHGNHQDKHFHSLIAGRAPQVRRA